MKWLDLDHADVDEHGSRGIHLAEVATLAEVDEFRVHVATFQPDAILGRHPTRLWQVFFVVRGTGWVSGADGERHTIRAGEAVVWEPGEAHESGSAEGMLVVMTQASVPLPPVKTPG